MKTAIIFGSSTGNTEEVAEKLRDLIGADKITAFLNVADMGPDDFKGYDNLIMGIPTWNTGELQEDWISVYSQLDGTDLSGTKICFFGLGDHAGYAHNFQDGMGILYEKFVELGATGGIGFWSNEDYEYEESLAVLNAGDTKFCGLAIDEDNESDLTDERLAEWAKQISAELQLA